MEDGSPIINKYGQLIAPKDYSPLVYNGSKDVWKFHIEQTKDSKLPSKIGDSLYTLEIDKIIAALGSRILNFKMDEDDIALHSQADTWQDYFGYRDLYDKVFKFGTGGEIGIYSDPQDHWWSSEEIWRSTPYCLPMTLNLYTNQNGKFENLYNWYPSEDQWWITGFNPDYKHLDYEYLYLLGSIDFTNLGDSYDSVKSTVQDNKDLEKYLICDDDNQIIWIIWWW